jgi:predicted RNA-binding protein with PUA-like domain
MTYAVRGMGHRRLGGDEMAAGNRWLLKTEPGEYSFDDLVREKRTVWDGVANPLALKHLRAIRRGDELLIYHTGNVRAAVGLAEAASDPYPDPARNEAKLVAVEVVPLFPLARPVTLEAIKADRTFRAFELVRLPRLSVMPVPEVLWRRILRMGDR